ncbi:hypothetical protein [Rickettsiella massiliensis]|uniref:hypothetical protein n=1 Tax=Rickettsiella massiliensis TaxID=676517 RepID=UPI0002F496CC|nr:hypothetical protein [Rickettsiella massiliensis]
MDKLNITVEDTQRTKSYQGKVKLSASKAYRSLSQFINDLQLEVQLLELTMDPSQIEQLKRAAELTRKTNQFNCTTGRYTDKQLQQLLNSSKVVILHIKDNERNYGLKGVIIFKIKNTALEVLNFLLSCEVLGRGAEHRILNELGLIAKKYNVPFIKFAFIPTDRNEPAKNFLANVCDPVLNEEGLITHFNISAESACLVKYDTTQSFAKYKKEKTLNTVEKKKKSENSIDYLTLANNLSTIEQIQSCLKIARRKNFIDTHFIAPENSLEKKLVNLWEETLGISGLGCTDNFTHQ